MAGGWSKDGAVQDQIDASVNEAVERARRQLPASDAAAAEFCEECEAEIPLARREAMPGVRCCIGCQQERDERQQRQASINRRGSKDSQLR